MAGEAYRAVFLRVHPTGKMVLSLTTDADGREGDYAALVGSELGVPPLVEPAAEEEPWASATPVAGSSVAMPSGYGPSRGNTTPGWSIGG